MLAAPTQSDLSHFKQFTVIGYWPDTSQRFATCVEATNADEAEMTCLDQYAGVVVCGVVLGRHECVDTGQND